MFAYRRATASLVLGGYQALGRGGGLVHFLIRLAIWHEIWRAIRAVWRIPTFRAGDRHRDRAGPDNPGHTETARRSLAPPQPGRLERWRWLWAAALVSAGHAPARRQAAA